MPIPKTRSDDAPPPLPPPTFIPELEHGHDAGWKFANDGVMGGFQKSTLAPIKQGSSLHGGYVQPRLNTKSRSEDQAEEMEIDDESARKGSTVSTIRSPSQPDIQVGNLGLRDDEQQNASSPSSIANQRCVYFQFVTAYIT
jgi:hypothetical protein